MHRRRLFCTRARFCLSLLVWLLYAIGAAAEATSSCSLSVRGLPGGLFKAAIACEGPTVLAAAGKQLGSSLQHSGVELDAAACDASDCLLSICSSAPLVLQLPIVADVTLPGLQGAILCFRGRSRAVLKRCVVANNTAGGLGAVHLGQQASVTFQGCAFSNNTAIDMDLAKGGALSQIDHATSTIEDSSFEGNQAVGGALARGGSIFASGSTRLTISNSSFVGNQATYVHAHPASTAGGAIAVEGRASAVISSSRFASNYAAGPVTGAGGAISAANTTSIVLRSCSFTNNSAGGYAAFGGAINGKANAAISVSDCSFSGNVANSSEVTSALPGEASVWGRAVGGCIIASDNVQLDVTNTTFRNNTSVRLIYGTASGGAITASKNARVRVVDSSFAGNTVIGDYGMGGGALTMSKTTRVTIHGSSFTDNEARCSSSCTGGAVHVGDSGVLTISSSLFLRNLADSPTRSGGSDSSGGGVGGLLNATILIENSTLINNTAVGYKSSGGGVYGDGMSRVTLINTTLVGNHAATGGGLGAVQGEVWVVRDCLFAGHSVPSHGGAIMIAGSPDVFITNSVLTGNRGAEGGGLYAHTFDAPFRLWIANTSISGNQAMTGGGLLFRGGEVHLGPGVAVVGNNATQEAGGLGWFSGCLGAAGLCPTLVNFACDAVVEGNSASVAGGGVFVGEGAAPEGGDLLNSCNRGFARNNRAAFGDADVFYVRRDCRQGEVSRGGWCDACPANMFSFDSNALRCDVCPPVGAVCPGGSVLLPQPGFWHSHNFSTQVHRCPNPHACEPPQQGAVDAGGGSHGPAQRRLLQSAGVPAANSSSGDMDWQCAAGYRGHLCGSCQRGHGMRSAFVCGECMPVVKTVLLYAAALVCVVLLLAFMAHVTWLDNRAASPVGCCQCTGSCAGCEGRQASAGDVLKVLVLFVQYLTILGAARVDWPGSMRAMFLAVAWVLSSCTGQVLSLDCIFQQQQGTEQLPSGIIRGLAYLVMPLVVAGLVMLLFALVWAVLAAHRSRQGRAVLALQPWLLMRLPVILLVVFYFFYPSLVRVAWAGFACYPIDVPGLGPYGQHAVANAAGGYWAASMDTVCWAGYHRVWALAVCLPFVLLFCVAVPAGIYVLLHLYNTGAFSSPNFAQNFGFLYRNFKPQRYYWEAVVAVQTVLLVCVYVFSHAIGVYYQVVATTVIFVVFSMAGQLLYRPYACDKLQHMQLMAAGCLCASSFVALTFFNVSGHTSIQRWKEAAGAIVLVLNASFLVYCVASVVLLAVAGVRQRLQAKQLPRRYGDQERAMMERLGGSACASSGRDGRHGALHECGSSRSSRSLCTLATSNSGSTACAVFIDGGKDVADVPSGLEPQPSGPSNGGAFAVALSQAAAAVVQQPHVQRPGAPPPAGACRCCLTGSRERLGAAID